MSERYSDKVPDGLDAQQGWSPQLGSALKKFLLSLVEGTNGLQTPPGDPTEIQAGEAADQGTSQAAAAGDHIHNVDTAAPSVSVALGGAPDEGAGTSLMRASATLVLDAGGAANNDALVWDTATTSWVPRPIGFSDSVMGQRVFAPRSDRYIPGPDDSQVVLAGRIFGR